MKKLISAALSAAIGLSSLTTVTAASAGGEKAAASKSGIVLLGDSISSGDLRGGKVKYNYGDICADYLGCKVYNYAVSGYDTDDLIKSIDSLTSDQKKTVADSEVVVISIGGNDIMHSLSKDLLDFAAG